MVRLDTARRLEAIHTRKADIHDDNAWVGYLADFQGALRAVGRQEHPALECAAQEHRRGGARALVALDDQDHRRLRRLQWLLDSVINGHFGSRTLLIADACSATVFEVTHLRLSEILDARAASLNRARSQGSVRRFRQSVENR